MRWCRVEGRASAGLLALMAAWTFIGCLGPRTQLPELDTHRIAEEREHQREAFLLADEARGRRLQNISFPLLQTATELFPVNPRPGIGIATMRSSDVQLPYRETAIRAFGLNEFPQVRSVVPGSPAASAGFRNADLLVSVGERLPARGQESIVDLLRGEMRIGEALDVRILREGTEETLTVTPAALAPYQVRLVYSPAINARATGRTIEINLGMLGFCENDTELAFVVAHELAHNALRHHRDFVVNYLLGTAADLALLALRIPSANAIGLTALYRPSEVYEVEADYVALYLLARQGHDLNELRDFWRRIALLGPERRPRRYSLWTHPEPAKRQILLEQAISEVQERLAAGLPLVPSS